MLTISPDGPRSQNCHGSKYSSRLCQYNNTDTIIIIIIIITEMSAMSNVSAIFSRAVLGCARTMRRAYEDCLNELPGIVEDLLCWPMKLTFFCKVADSKYINISNVADHRQRGSDCTVLTATGLVNGEWQTLTPYRIETP